MNFTLVTQAMSAQSKKLDWPDCAKSQTLGSESTSADILHATGKRGRATDQDRASQQEQSKEQKQDRQTDQ
jgi:hypothetical protein